MDEIVANRMEKELTGESLAGWELGACIGHGKSAVVFRATKGGREAAVKVFDRELVQRFGKKAQRERVMREEKLIGLHHPNLIEILAAGEALDHDLFYVAMALVDPRNLDDVRDEIPVEKVQVLLSQIASAARFLEEHDHAHRDIKPENISVSDDLSTAVLLDLGVIRPIGLGNITDDKERRNFVGTLRYAPPELLFREELDSKKGWRAVTFYQLGAVLYDLIAKNRLFEEFSTPYPRLVEAVKSEVPIIVSSDAPPDLVQLATNCLLKNPETRLKLVCWDSFSREPSSEDDIAAARERIRQRLCAAEEDAVRPQSELGDRQVLKTTAMQLENSIRTAVAAAEAFPPLTFRAEDPDADHVCLFASFPESNPRMVKFPFVVVFVIQLLDPSEKVIRVTAGLQAGSNAICTRSTMSQASIFEGVFVDDVVQQKTNDYLIMVLDRVHRCASEPEITSGAWISLNGRT